MLRTYRGMHPQIAPNCFIEASAQIIGDVTIGEHSSVWFNSVVRGDVERIIIGHHSNVQDLCMIHVTRDTHPTRIGNFVSLGHGVIAHGCTIEDRCLIGMGARVMDAVVVGAESIIAAGAVVTAGTQIPPRSLAAGVPAVIKKQLGDQDLAYIDRFWKNYIEYKDIYLNDVPHRT
ncbi:MAG TPA: gamma carbonic anhydrase family protein [Blastocatellia bacterium]|nr:gamma carbonic anhydrase family protein [Blastocatellia bacterium]